MRISPRLRVAALRRVQFSSFATSGRRYRLRSGGGLSMPTIRPTWTMLKAARARQTTKCAAPSAFTDSSSDLVWPYAMQSTIFRDDTIPRHHRLLL